MGKPMNREQRRKHAKQMTLLGLQLNIHKQVAADAAAIAANEVLQMGPGRAEQFHDAYCSNYYEIIEAINTDPDYAFDIIDRRMKPIFGDKYQPCRFRYDGRIGGKIK